MGIFGYCEYAAVNSRVHYVKSRMLGKEEWQSMMEAQTLASALYCLSCTSLGEGLSVSRAEDENYLDSSKIVLPFLRDVEHLVHQNFIKSASSHLRFLHGEPAGCLKSLLQIYDLMNLKKAVRQQFCEEGGEGKLDVKYYDLGPASVIGRQKWEQLVTVEKLGKALKGTCYEVACRNGFASVGEEKNILQLELQLEKCYFTELYRKLEACGGEAKNLLKLFMDEVCLEYAARLLYHHKLGAPAVMPLLPLHIAAHWNEKLYEKVSAAPDVQGFLAALGEARHFGGLDLQSISACLGSLRAIRAAEAKRILRMVQPLSLSPLVACFFLRRQEIRDITGILQAKRFHRPGTVLNPVLPGLMQGVRR